MAKIPSLKSKEQDSAVFSVLALGFGALSLYVWLFAILGLALGVRGFVLSRQLENRRDLLFATAGIALSAFGIVQYFGK